MYVRYPFLKPGVRDLLRDAVTEDVTGSPVLACTVRRLLQVQFLSSCTAIGYTA
jgi:hypothetical protein